MEYFSMWCILNKIQGYNYDFIQQKTKQTPWHFSVQANAAGR
jgi:hypothetical protein